MEAAINPSRVVRSLARRGLVARESGYYGYAITAAGQAALGVNSVP